MDAVRTLFVIRKQKIPVEFPQFFFQAFVNSLQGEKRWRSSENSCLWLVNMLWGVEWKGSGTKTASHKVQFRLIQVLTNFSNAQIVPDVALYWHPLNCVDAIVARLCFVSELFQTKIHNLEMMSSVFLRSITFDWQSSKDDFFGNIFPRTPQPFSQSKFNACNKGPRRHWAEGMTHGPCGHNAQNKDHHPLTANSAFPTAEKKQHWPEKRKNLSNVQWNKQSAVCGVFQNHKIRRTELFSKQVSNTLQQTTHCTFKTGDLLTETCFVSCHKVSSHQAISNES